MARKRAPRSQAEGRRQRLNAAQRAEFARARRAMEGKLILQKGFEGACVVRHIRGSQYLIRLADGSEVYASHKKHPRTGAVSRSGWKLWEDRS